MMIITSCNSHLEETRGVDEVISYYGGNCKYSVGTSISTNNSTNHYLELELSNSQSLEPFIDIADLPASNIAYLCYHHLDNNKTTYNQINTILVFKGGKRVSFSYATSQLDMVEKKMLVLDKVISLLKMHNYRDIKALLDDKAQFKYNKDTLVSSIIKAEPVLGDIKGFKTLGFQIITIDGIDLLHLSGVIERKKTSHQFSIDIDTDLNKNQIINLQYKL
ncbi:hypothetical protein [Mucilaginibacter sp. UR6-11]|uniref:hypothetical protein n=1 Tax=Mucilaginibacter sp. UR6-11 TaxID=1435644 RepID=UPI001E3C0B57|nr:hypothetical protein [Mucilaginibacter sp. UR6-11]MCC8427304.1 hypothetical protein [Mucilaginibacter sp. UR6-11]